MKYRYSHLQRQAVNLSSGPSLWGKYVYVLLKALCLNKMTTLTFFDAMICVYCIPQHSMHAYHIDTRPGCRRRGNREGGGYGVSNTTGTAVSILSYEGTNV